MIETLTKNTVTATAFENLILAPLESVLGQTLCSVSYGLLDYQRELSLAEQPNELDLLFVKLCFLNTALEVSWDFEKSLRGDDLAYHVQVVPAGQTYRIIAEDAGNHCEAANVDALPWREALGKKLTAVRVLGIQGSPQAIQFSFGSIEIVVAVGYSGEELLVGDGDDVLVFSKQEWQHKKSIYGAAWETLWTASGLY